MVEHRKCQYCSSRNPDMYDVCFVCHRPLQKESFSREQAAQEFITRWSGRGSEREETRSFWIDLLVSVYQQKHAAKQLQFERVTRDGGRIDVYWPLTGLLIEQKSLGIDLNKSDIRQGADVTPVQQAFRYVYSAKDNMKVVTVCVCNFGEFRFYHADQNLLKNPEPILRIRLEQLPRYVNEIGVFLCNESGDNSSDDYLAISHSVRQTFKSETKEEIAARKRPQRITNASSFSSTWHQARMDLARNAETYWKSLTRALMCENAVIGGQHIATCDAGRVPGASWQAWLRVNDIFVMQKIARNESDIFENQAYKLASVFYANLISMGYEPLIICICSYRRFYFYSIHDSIIDRQPFLDFQVQELKRYADKVSQIIDGQWPLAQERATAYTREREYIEDGYRTDQEHSEHGKSCQLSMGLKTDDDIRNQLDRATNPVHYWGILLYGKKQIKYIQQDTGAIELLSQEAYETYIKIGKMLVVHGNPARRFPLSRGQITTLAWQAYERFGTDDIACICVQINQRFYCYGSVGSVPEEVPLAEFSLQVLDDYTRTLSKMVDGSWSALRIQHTVHEEKYPSKDDCAVAPPFLYDEYSQYSDIDVNDLNAIELYCQHIRKVMSVCNSISWSPLNRNKYLHEYRRNAGIMNALRARVFDAVKQELASDIVEKTTQAFYLTVRYHCFLFQGCLVADIPLERLANIRRWSTTKWCAHKVKPWPLNGLVPAVWREGQGPNYLYLTVNADPFNIGWIHSIKLSGSEMSESLCIQMESPYRFSTTAPHAYADPSAPVRARVYDLSRSDQKYYHIFDAELQRDLLDKLVKSHVVITDHPAVVDRLLMDQLKGYLEARAKGEILLVSSLVDEETPTTRIPDRDVVNMVDAAISKSWEFIDNDVLSTDLQLEKNLISEYTENSYVMHFPEANRMLKNGFPVPGQVSVQQAGILLANILNHYVEQCNLYSRAFVTQDSDKCLDAVRLISNSCHDAIARLQDGSWPYGTCDDILRLKSIFHDTVQALDADAISYCSTDMKVHRIIHHHPVVSALLRRLNTHTDFTDYQPFELAKVDVNANVSGKPSITFTADSHINTTMFDLQFTMEFLNSTGQVIGIQQTDMRDSQNNAHIASTIKRSMRWIQNGGHWSTDTAQGIWSTMPIPPDTNPSKVTSVRAKRMTWKNQPNGDTFTYMLDGTLVAIHSNE